MLTAAVFDGSLLYYKDGSQSILRAVVKFPLAKVSSRIFYKCECLLPRQSYFKGKLKGWNSSDRFYRQMLTKSWKNENILLISEMCRKKLSEAKR